MGRKLEALYSSLGIRKAHCKWLQDKIKEVVTQRGFSFYGIKIIEGAAEMLSNRQHGQEICGGGRDELGSE